MKKITILLVMFLSLIVLISCKNKETTNETSTTTTVDSSNESSTEEQTESTTEEEQITLYDYTIQLPSTELLENATDIQVVEGAPELMILEAVLDTYYYYHYETMSGYEYIKVFNNTESDYNLKNHRIVVANPTQGQNFENEVALKGNEILSTGYLFMGLIDEDFIIPSLETALIWIKPYYWTAGSGTGAYNKPFSPVVIHRDNDEQKGAFSQTIADFKEFWQIEEAETPVYELTNMGLIGKRADGGTDGLFPIYSPGSGTMFTHFNSSLIRSLEIQKFNDQDGAASISLLNKYSELSEEKQTNPDFIYGKKAFNVMEIKENGEVVDGYFFENAWKYFDPVVRINVAGLVDTTSMTAGQTHVDFNGTSNPGVSGWGNTIGLQFRPPLEGERIMQLQLPLREYTKFETYMNPTQFSVMRFVKEEVKDYRFINKTIKLVVDPSLGLDLINWKTDEAVSVGRLSCAAPTSIKTINLTRPAK